MVLFTYISFAFEGLWLHIVRKQRFYAVLAVLVIVVIPTWILLIPVGDFPKGALVEVEEDAPFGETAALLENRHIVGSATLLKVLARITGIDTSVKAGRYLFSTPQGVAMVLYRLSTGDSGITAIRVTFPEGISVRQMGDILASSIPGFDADTFVAEAKLQEGYLFPDTYAFYSDVTPEEVIERLHSRFNEVWLDIVGGKEFETAYAGEKERDVIMASILEKETKPGEDRRTVAGILFNRLAINMPLQVDAVFGYIKGVDTYHPSAADLDIDSPYNTYKYPGLPPGPIGNPGKEAILDVITPAPSDFLYYLTGTDGQMHYAKTFEKHKKNKELYLR